MFDESCRQARRLYLLGATVALAVGLFALNASHPEDLYRRAQSQVGAALAIDWSAYRAFVDDRLAEVAQQRYVDRRNDFYGYLTLVGNRDFRLIRLSPYEAVHQPLDSEALFERLMQDSPYAQFGGDIDALRQAEIGYLIEHHHAVLASTFSGYQSARGDRRAAYELTPVDLVRFLKSPTGRANAAIVTPDPATVASRVLELTGQRTVRTARGTPAAAAVAGIAAEARAELTSTNFVDRTWQDARLPTVRLGLRIEILALDAEGGAASAEAGWRREDPPVATLDAAVVEVPGTSLASWVARQWPALGVERDGALEPFAGLRHVWPTIADRPLLDADLYLAAALSEEEATAPEVSLGGVEIPSSLVPVGGPLVLAVLLLQLTRVLGFLEQRAPMEAARRDAPWLILHSRHGFLEAAVVLLCLPLAAQTLVTWRALSADPAVLAAGWAATLLAVGAGSASVLRIRRLQRAILPGHNQQPNGADPSEETGP